MSRALVVLALASCGRLHFNALGDGGPLSNPDGDGGSSTSGPPDQSGTRLKLEHDDFADGTRLVTGVYDAMLATPCTPATWSDGNAYCLPDSQPVVYADAACTQRIGHQTGCLGPSAYFLEDLRDACNASTTRAYYPRGAATTVAKYYTAPAGGGCVQFSSTTTDAFYALGPAVNVPATFAALTKPVAATTGRLAHETWQSSDGFSLEAGLRDTQLAADCTVADYENGHVCQPPGVARTLNFSDSACTAPVAEVTTGCTAPSYIASWPFGGCGLDTPRFASVGAVVGGSTVWGDTGTCTSATMTGVTLYGAGAPVTMPAITVAADQTAGQRLQLVRSIGDGASQRRAYLRDTQLGIDCTPMVAADGVLRCLPVLQAGFATFYTNAICSNAILGAFWGNSGGPCTSPPVPTYAISDSSCAAPAVHVRPMTTAYTGPVYLLTGTTCISVGGTPFYNVGAEVAAATFVQGTAGRDP